MRRQGLLPGLRLAPIGQLHLADVQDGRLLKTLSIQVQRAEHVFLR